MFLSYPIFGSSLPTLRPPYSPGFNVQGELLDQLGQVVGHAAERGIFSL
jgi:hypothetical protein